MTRSTGSDDRLMTGIRRSGAVRAATRASLVVAFAVVMTIAAVAVARAGNGDSGDSLTRLPVSGASASDGIVLARSSFFAVVRPSARASGFQTVQPIPSLLSVPAPSASGTATVTARIRSCPDDVVATTFEQFVAACTDSSRLYRVPIGLAVNGGAVSYQYTHPEHAAIVQWFPPAGAMALSDSTPGRLHEPVVFCTVSRVGGIVHTMGDGSVGPAVNGALTFALAANESYDCQWFRFPGGVSAAGATPSPSPQPSGGAITIHMRLCTPPVGTEIFTPAPSPFMGPATSTEFPLPYVGDPRFDSGRISNACAISDVPFDFTVTEPTSGFSESAAIPDNQFPVGWHGLGSGDYTVTEAVPAGYGVPYVFCQVSHREQLTLPGYTQLPVSGGAVVVPMDVHWLDFQWNCDWYNVLPGGAVSSPGASAMPSSSGGPAASGGAPASVDPSDRGTSSITIAAWQCPDGLEFETAARDGECLEAITGLTFIADGPDDYHAQTDTGDSQPGAVFFGGIDPGIYTVTTPTSLDPPVVYCDGVDVPSDAGQIQITLPAHIPLQCDWYLPAADIAADGDAPEAGEPADPAVSDDPATSDPGVSDPLIDTDEDGLIDSDEAGIYGTDPNDADTDDDGLLDGAELSWNGTDPLLADTDGDGLTDGVEANVTLTDPLDPDSDDDTYTDGYEVLIGSDPNNDHEIPVS